MIKVKTIRDNLQGEGLKKNRHKSIAWTSTSCVLGYVIDSTEKSVSTEAKSRSSPLNPPSVMKPLMKPYETSTFITLFTRNRRWV